MPHKIEGFKGNKALLTRLSTHKTIHNERERERDFTHNALLTMYTSSERWRAGVETQKNVRGKIGGWGRVPFNEPYVPLLSTIYDGA